MRDIGVLQGVIVFPTSWQFAVMSVAITAVPLLELSVGIAAQLNKTTTFFGLTTIPMSTMYLTVRWV